MGKKKICDVVIHPTGTRKLGSSSNLTSYVLPNGSIQNVRRVGSRLEVEDNSVGFVYEPKIEVAKINIPEICKRRE